MSVCFVVGLNEFIKTRQFLPYSLTRPFPGMRLTLSGEEKDVICYFKRRVRYSSSLYGFICVLIAHRILGQIWTNPAIGLNFLNYVFNPMFEFVHI